MGPNCYFTAIALAGRCAGAGKIVLSIVVLLTTNPLVKAQPYARGPNHHAERKNDIFRITRDSSRERSIEIKWAVGKIDTIRTVRVPWGYRSLLLGDSEGAQLMDNSHEESKANGFSPPSLRSRPSRRT